MNHGDKKGLGLRGEPGHNVNNRQITISVTPLLEITICHKSDTSDKKMNWSDLTLAHRSIYNSAGDNILDKLDLDMSVVGPL